MKAIKNKYKIVIISLLFFILPFFWLRPGELDIGGDSTRLYLYDPWSYLTSTALYSIDPQGTGKTLPNQNLLPYVAFLGVVKTLVGSSYVFVVLEKSVKLTLSFLFLYLLICELLKNYEKRIETSVIQASAIVAGVFYAVSPAITGNMGNALLTHQQVFVYPAVLYFLLRYVTTRDYRYLWLTLGITLLFSSLFSLLAPPPPFAFLPLSLFFLILYFKLVTKIKIPWKELFFGTIIFIGIHAYHLVPAVFNILDVSSELHQRTLEGIGSNNPGLEYFNSILSLGKVSTNILYPAGSFLSFPMIIGAITVIGAFLFNKKRSTLLELISLFYIITLYLVSANILNIGVLFYRFFFSIPGFGMFRNFIGQWQFIFAFFYALLLGVSLVSILIKFSRFKQLLVLGYITIFILGNYFFLKGESIRVKHRDTEISTLVEIDPSYDKVLKFIRTLPDDGKILVLPFSDFSYQVVQGKNGGAYIGPSTIAYLTGKNDFSGYQVMYPFPEDFFRFTREQKYSDIERLFSLLGITYIFHNSDTKIYESGFKKYPYDYANDSLPNTQKGIDELISHFNRSIIFEEGPYKIYRLNSEYSTPLIHASQRVAIYDDGSATAFFEGDTSKITATYIARADCQKISSTFCETISQIDNTQEIKYRRISPTTYLVRIENFHKKPVFLTFLRTFSTEWKIYNPISEIPTTENNTRLIDQLWQDIRLIFNRKLSPINSHHIKVNAYANGWLIPSQDANLTILIQNRSQYIFYVASSVSILFVVGFSIWGILLFTQQLRTGIIGDNEK